MGCAKKSAVATHLQDVILDANPQLEDVGLRMQVPHKLRTSWYQARQLGIKGEYTVVPSCQI